MADDTISILPGPKFKSAFALALLADALQIVIFPLFAGGAFSPAEDALDLCVAGILVNLLGWHWEFLPSFLVKLVPGVDLVPFWTIAVVNVYRKSKRAMEMAEPSNDDKPMLTEERCQQLKPRSVETDRLLICQELKRQFPRFNGLSARLRAPTKDRCPSVSC